MFTSRSKGQVVQLIAVVFLFLIVIVLALFQFATLITGGNIVEETITAKFEYEMGDTRRTSALQSSLSDYVWRAPSISEERYGDTSAYELSSLYFSSNGEEVRLKEESFESSQVRNDLKHYFSYKMNRTWLGQDAFPVDYQVTVGVGHEDNFTVSVRERHSGSNWRGVSLPVALQTGNETDVNLYTRTQYSIFEVDGL